MIRFLVVGAELMPVYKMIKEPDSESELNERRNRNVTLNAFFLFHGSLNFSFSGTPFGNSVSRLQ